MAKMWSGRFSKETDAKMDDFHSSLSFDRRLYKEDIAGSRAHVRMLAKCGIITDQERDLILEGLKKIEKRLDEGALELPPQLEDIHMAVEHYLIQEIGEVGKKLHTARSRNDQVATDLRLYFKKTVLETAQLLVELCQVLLVRAKAETETLLPGYTHLQPAQPISLGHHLLAYYEMFSRDLGRLLDCLARADFSPLGSGALAGVTYPIDREMTAKELGFRAPAANSLDAVSDRDFLVEFLAAASLIMTHLSRLSEELVLWATPAFGFVELDDAYSTGSSIMPQKKNPDVPELVRGKTGRVFGSLIGLLTVLKGLPLAYNKDLQEDKEAFFDAADNLKASLSIFIPLLETMGFNRERMFAACAEGYLNATDVADYLAKKGLPFREAHRIVGEVVRQATFSGKKLEDLTLEEWQEFSDLFEADILQVVEIRACLEARQSYGGTAPRRVREAVQEAEERIRQIKEKLQDFLRR
ncbi:MAG: argininosuccinate lyase [Firmicutes bacterium]|nr:argininosuccinate lyase [Bacillota bacterium]